MVKSIAFSILCFLLLLSNSLVAQKSDGLSFEIATTVGYSHFALASNPNTALWNLSGIEEKTKGGLLYGFGIGVARPVTDRISWNVGIQVVQGRFNYQLEGLVTADDLINSFDDPETSTWKFRFQYWNLEIPVRANFSFSNNPNAIALILGGGMAKNLSSKGNKKINYSDGREEELETPGYETEVFNGFGLLGLEKSFALSSSDRNLLLRVIGKYYLVQEGLGLFEERGNLFNTNLEMVYRF